MYVCMSYTYVSYGRGMPATLKSGVKLFVASTAGVYQHQRTFVCIYIYSYFYMQHIPAQAKVGCRLNDLAMARSFDAAVAWASLAIAPTS